MKLPKISILTLMAIVLVVALDGMAARWIASRPGFLTGWVWFVAMMTLPMIHALAIAASLRSQRRGPGRAFLVGFEVAGWLAVGATFAVGLVAMNPLIDDVLDPGLAALGVPTRTGTSRFREAVLLYGVFPVIFLVPQMVVALIGGFVAGRVWGLREEAAPALESSANRSRWIPLAWLVLTIAVPTIAIEVYLRLKADPQMQAPAIIRLPPGSLSVVVDLKKVMPITLPDGSPLAGLDGLRVKIDSDAAAMEYELIATSGGDVTILRDLRDVRVTLLDGSRKGESIAVPRCLLRPVP